MRTIFDCKEISWLNGRTSRGFRPWNACTRLAGVNCQVHDNDLTADPSNLPEAAQAIIKNAGLEAGYIKIKDEVK